MSRASTPASPSPPSSPRGAATEVARCVLARYGADLADAARPEHSASNEVWLAEQVVIRVSRAPDGSLRREAELATILPAVVGYPVVHEVGHNAHVEWMVTERLPGTNLEESWPDLDGTTRSNAVVDLWTRLLAVHQTDARRARSIGSDSASTPFSALDESEASGRLAWLASEGAVEPDLRDVLADMLDQMIRAIPLVPLVLSHTDAGPHNAVWTGRAAIPLDFEFASVAPADLDLESMLRTLAILQGPEVSDKLVSQASGMLAAPGARSRLWGYAILRDLWGLRGWLRHVRSNGDVEQWSPASVRDDIHSWAPWLHLRAHADRTSWLAGIL
jgi:aminoglycoside phosphotransferase